MNSSDSHLSGAWLWYRRLVACYPVAFRERYGEEMIRMFDEGWSRACDQGAGARRRYARYVVWDALRTLPKELYSAAPAQWAGFIAAAAILKLLSFLDLRIGCCVLIFFGYFLLLKLTLHRGNAFLLTQSILCAPIAYGIAHLLGDAGIWALTPRWPLNRDLLLLACFSFSFIHSWRNKSEVRVDAKKSFVVSLGLITIAIGLGFGGASWLNNIVFFAWAYTYFLIISPGLKLYFKVWRGRTIASFDEAILLRTKNGKSS